jgi:hypothetical protein
MSRLAGNRPYRHAAGFDGLALIVQETLNADLFKFTFLVPEFISMVCKVPLHLD